MVFAPQDGALVPSWLKDTRNFERRSHDEGGPGLREGQKSRFGAV